MCNASEAAAGNTDRCLRSKPLLIEAFAPLTPVLRRLYPSGNLSISNRFNIRFCSSQSNFRVMPTGLSHAASPPGLQIDPRIGGLPDSRDRPTQ